MKVALYRGIVNIINALPMPHRQPVRDCEASRSERTRLDIALISALQIYAPLRVSQYMSMLIAYVISPKTNCSDVKLNVSFYVSAEQNNN